MTDKKNETQELIVSKQLIINDRFLIKISKMDTGVYKKSILLVVRDMLESNFKMQYYDSEDEAALFIETLRQI